MNTKLLDAIACPTCRGKLLYNEQVQQLYCSHDQLIFAVDDNIPVLLESAGKQQEVNSA